MDIFFESLRSAVLFGIVVLKLAEFLKYSIFNRKFSIIIKYGSCTGKNILP